ncbi:tRNA lysidine(34) synthetase TilS [Shewanella sp. UCD-KL12]|uniref:tRNA lysidine(34) synthetase TilS n=1 Tax=Shewanella sp. UCD-KL12 TaxID=1917163 RepID=UPI0009712357|nr:tRNA lysidine(34) synthetase TilS [Shewanella sp. UCD-KL12]
MPTNGKALSGFSVYDLIDEVVALASVKQGAKLVLAYSGGVDSELLARGLSEFAKVHTQFSYLLIHVHHGLSQNADLWAEHCRNQAKSYRLPIKVSYVHVDTGPRKSIEAEARTARYNAIKAEMNAGDVLLTGHHLDDQLETVLLALKRGLGPKGLSAMGSVQRFDNDKLMLRPLLSIEREQIESQALSLALKHIKDESNLDAKYDRNFLRLEIIPKLKSRWPSIATTASRSASLCAQQQVVIDEEVSARLPDYLVLRQGDSVQALDLERLSSQSPHWQALLFRGFIEHLGFAPLSVQQLEQALSQLLSAKPDANLEFRAGDLIIRRFRGLAYLSSFRQEHLSLDQDMLIELDSAAVLHMLDDIEVAVSPVSQLVISKTTKAMGVRLPKLAEQISIRFSVVGSTRCQPAQRAKRRELKKLWQEYGIPPWQRAQVPFIFYNEQLVCAVGYWVESAFVANDGEAGLAFSQTAR